MNLDDWNLPVIKKLSISDTKGKRYNFDLPLGGFGISRYVSDEALYKIALQKGVTVLTKTKVQDIVFADEQLTIQTQSGNYQATIAAGTFGKRSNLDIKWERGFTQQKPGKLNNYVGVKYHIRYPVPADTISLHNFKNGYCGISQVEENKCCLCYLTTAANLQSAGNSIKQMEEQVLYKNPLLQQIFTRAEFLYKEPLTISQVSFHKKTQVENHVLLMGDAAGMITPLCGNGMSMAMHAAKIAFSNIDLFLQHNITRNEMESSYTTQWRQHFQQRLQMGRLVQRCFGNDLATSLFLRGMNAIPALAKMVIGATHGEIY